MRGRYTDEANVQILIALMKHHGVKRVIASPGTTNITFVGSIQDDPWFEVYSSVDERSAAYMACGMAAETGEPVALSCTGATASRNYFPGLTEAFYRKLPVIAITATQHLGRVGNNVPQVLDRSSVPKDACKLSIDVRTIHTDEDRSACETSINGALLELRRHGGGPVHINLETTYNDRFTTAELPDVRCIDRVIPGDPLPSLEGKSVAIFVGAHAPWNDALTEAVDRFCATHDGVVICDQTSNYRGRYRILGALVAKQERYAPACNHVDVMIYIGDISGSYMDIHHDETWRVNPDGEIRDAFGGLRYVFEMDEESFFSAYADFQFAKGENDFFRAWQEEDERLRAKIPELPFSNIWCASVSASMLPRGAVLHLGILNSLRSWNFFETPESIKVFCNTGGFGIDGCMSTLLGASLASPDKLFFCVLGDLAGFYDLNSLGNRHLPANIRIMLINNGVGTEFKNYNHMAGQFGTDADAFIAARGHFGGGSRQLLKHYTQDLSFEYLSASTKDEFATRAELFFTSDRLEHPLFFEVFTDSDDESEALKTISQLEVSVSLAAKEKVAHVLGERGVKVVKKVLGR